MSTPKQANSEIIAAFLDAVMRKDASLIDRFFAPGVEYMVNGASKPDRSGALPPISAECQAALPGLACTEVETQARNFWRIGIAIWRSSLLGRAR